MNTADSEELFRLAGTRALRRHLGAIPLTLEDAYEIWGIPIGSASAMVRERLTAFTGLLARDQFALEVDVPRPSFASRCALRVLDKRLRHQFGREIRALTGE